MSPARFLAHSGKLDADVRVAMPFHGIIDRKNLDARRVLTDVKVPTPDGEEKVDLWYTEVRHVPVYLIQHDRYFDRPKVYGYDDDVERTQFYCAAVLAIASHIGFKPSVIHAQDWHAAMLLARLSVTPHVWAATGRVYTIHNLALKGDFDPAFAQRYHIGPELLALPGRPRAGDRIQQHGPGHPARGQDQHRERDVRARDPDARIRRRARPAVAGARRRPDGHRQRDRLRGVQPGDRPGDREALQPRDAGRPRAEQAGAAARDGAAGARRQPAVRRRNPPLGAEGH